MSEIERFERLYIARQWWKITQPGGETFELWVPDGITHADVLKRYPHAGIVAA